MATRDELWKHLDNVLSASLNSDNISWVVFSVFWAGNAILLANLGGGHNPASQILLPGVGVFGSTVWWIIQARALAYQRFRERIVADLEQYLLGSRGQELYAFSRNPRYTAYLGTTLRAKRFMGVSAAVFAHVWALLLGGMIGSFGWFQIHVKLVAAGSDSIVAMLAVIAWVFFCGYCRRIQNEGLAAAGSKLWIASLLLGTLSLVSFAGIGLFFLGPHLTSLLY